MEVGVGKNKKEEHDLQRGPEPEDRVDQPGPAGPPPQEANKPEEKKEPMEQNPAGRGTEDSFIGRAAQLAVMAELMRRLCNAAIPEIDLGTDVFAFKDDRAEVVRIQVKACTSPYSYADGSGYSARFALPMKQFQRLDDRPQVFYALAVLRDEKWIDFLIVSRARLQGYFYGKNKFGSYSKKNDELTITIEFRAEVKCSGQELTDCRNAWNSLPPLKPPPDLEDAAQGQASAVDPSSGGTDGSDQPTPETGQP
jgi:hypothetical protein